MKILHVIPSISPVRGGTSRAVIDMVHALLDRGIDVEIATTNDDGDDLLDVPLGKLTLYDRIPTYFFSRFSPPLPALREFAFSGSFTTWLFQNIAKYDAIHVHALFSYTSTADLFALTSHSENFGISVLEALVVGTPVLVTPGVGLATIVRQHHLGYVAELDIDAITQALDRHLTDPNCAKQMGIRARQFTIENYNWDKIATDLIQVYESLA